MNSSNDNSNLTSTFESNVSQSFSDANSSADNSGRVNSDSVIISDDYLVSEQINFVSSTKFDGYKKIVFQLGYLLLVANLLILPFLFGGVHETSFLTFRIASFLALTAILILPNELIKKLICAKKQQGKALITLSFINLYLLVHTFFYFINNVEHPVLNKVSSLFNPQIAFNTILDFLNFSALYFITLCWLNRGEEKYSQKRSLQLSNLILFSAFLVALTALSQWFYDNGKLFWTFSANTESISNRARWPFVNPNHLGIYLCIPLFLAIGRVEQAFQDLKIATIQLRRRGKIILSELITDSLTQKITRSIIILSLFILTIGLAMVASLSRNAITSTFLSLILFYFLSPKKRVAAHHDKQKFKASIKTEVYESESVTAEGKIRRRTKRSRTRDSNAQLYGIDITKAIPYLRVFSRTILVLSTIGVFWFFLGEKGGELFKSRLEYALIYTQDDMRWQLYNDSLGMIASSPIFGIGIGNWAEIYPQFMAEGLSGMNPGYLHSDLFQITIEIGLLGGLILLISAIYISSLILKNQFKGAEDNLEIQESKSKHSRAMYFGFLALILSSSFEFPFRIPSIVSLFAIALALELYTVSKRHKA